MAVVCQVLWSGGWILNISRSQHMLRWRQIGTSKALVNLIHTSLNLLVEWENPTPKSPHKFSKIRHKMLDQLCQCQARNPDTKFWGAIFRVFRHWITNAFALKDLPNSQKNYKVEWRGTTSSQIQTSASSRLLDKSLELAWCPCAFVRTICTRYPPHTPRKQTFHEMTGIFPKHNCYLYHVLLIWRV